MSETAPAINTQRAILLLMDYQRSMLEMAGEAAWSILPRAHSVLETAHRGGMRVGYVRVAFDEIDFRAIPERNKAFSGIATSRRLENGSSGAAIHESVAPQPDDLVIRKTRVGALLTTDLDWRLREMEIDTLILAGISTSGVVLSTVRDAADRDYRVYVLEDLCFDGDPEVHRVLMEKVFPRQSWVVKAADLAGLIGA